MRKQLRPKRTFAHVLIRPPQSRASNGAQTLNRELGNVSRLSRINPVPRQYRTLINWGNTEPVAERVGLRVLNKPAAIARAVNKITCLQTLQAAGVRVPEFSTVAPERDRAIWLARTNVRGSGGDGIIVVRRDDALPAAPLYVKYIKKTEEYRVHVIKHGTTETYFIQQKKRKVTDVEVEQTKDQKLIRNHDNGWVFCPLLITEDNPQRELRGPLMATALQAVNALGLDFAAVDLIIGRDDDLPYILELNTAPGIESPTLTEAYREAFTRLVTI
jgi:biotin carboxylase